ncbi:hypothetical protein P691DRAFT_766112 [Macrolepiota fuliginosa MF-IS2]|uniref:Uncharacterized protein n=1 Tax=Macrolepiota fuliginosa MF-IS2 TaxID=1400762 RepID=A0A9P5X0Y1_9AGAR|nr:hypothetical protein P691DRAFT_766112 [Macrolepiota fuliginosa MF-IS2]
MAVGNHWKETTETEVPEEGTGVSVTPAADAELIPTDEAVVIETIASKAENPIPQETPTDDLPVKTSPAVSEPTEPAIPATEETEEPAREATESEVTPPSVEDDLPAPHDEASVPPARAVEPEAMPPADDIINGKSVQAADPDDATQPFTATTEDTPEAPAMNGEATCTPASEITNGNGRHHTPAPKKANVDDEIPIEMPTVDSMFTSRLPPHSQGFDLVAVKHDIKSTPVQASSESIPSESSPETLPTTATDG